VGGVNTGWKKQPKRSRGESKELGGGVHQKEITPRGGLRAT